jgi:hypothetical protein
MGTVRRKFSIQNENSKIAAILRDQKRSTYMSENRVLRTILEHKRDELTSEWSKLHKEQPQDLYTSANVIRVINLRRMRWAVHLAGMGEIRGAYMVVVRKPEGKRPIGTTWRRWEDNIKMNLKYICSEGVDWIYLTQDMGKCRGLVNMVMNHRVP